MSDSRPDHPPGLTRRRFLEVTGKSALLAACASALPGRLLYADDEGETVGMVFFPNFAPAEVDADAVREHLREAIAAVGGFAWLSAGQSVAINVATNSPKPYPMTTHPVALAALVGLLKEAGAGRVVIADLAGVENVAPAVSQERDRYNEKIRDLYKKMFGPAMGPALATSGMDVLERTGIAAAVRAVGGEVQSFDGVDDWIHVGDAGLGWSHAVTPNWEEDRPSIPRGGFRVPKLVTEVDHLVNFARPSGHVMAGHTGTIKNWYGWIHPLDRLWSHSRLGFRKLGDMRAGLQLNPLNPVKVESWEVKLLHERVAEVAKAFDPKTRLNLMAGIDTYVDIGPDWGVQPLQQSWIFASGATSAIDAATTAALAHEKRRVPREERAKNWEGSRWRFNSESFWGAHEGGMHRYHGTWAFDRQVEDPTAAGIWESRQLAHAREIGLSGDPSQARYLVSGEPNQDYLRAIGHLTGGEQDARRGMRDMLPNEGGR